jgi:hypothetical protein
VGCAALADHLRAAS